MYTDFVNKEELTNARLVLSRSILLLSTEIALALIVAVTYDYYFFATGSKISNVHAVVNANVLKYKILNIRV